MRIEQAQSLGILSAQNKAQTTLKKIGEKLATGLAINRASDNAAGLSISEQLRTQIRGFQSANTNLEYAQAAQYIAEGTGNETTSMLQRQRELAVQAANGTLTPDNRSALNQEYQALNAELTRISSSSNFNGQNVAGGTDLGAGTGQVLAGPNPGSNLSIAGANFTAANLGTAPTDILSPENAAAAVSALDTALQNASAQRTNIGASINRMDFAMRANENGAAMTQDAESRIRDLDYAQGVMEQTTASLLSQTGLAAQKNFNEISRNNLMALLK